MCLSFSPFAFAGIPVENAISQMDNKHKKQNLIKAWWVGVGIALLIGLRHFLALSAADRRRDEAILHPLHIPLLPQVTMKIDIKLRERLQFIACSPPPGKAYGKIAHPKKAGSSNPSPPLQFQEK